MTRLLRFDIPLLLFSIWYLLSNKNSKYDEVFLWALLKSHVWGAQSKYFLFQSSQLTCMHKPFKHFFTIAFIVSRLMLAVHSLTVLKFYRHFQWICVFCMTQITNNIRLLNIRLRNDLVTLT